MITANTPIIKFISYEGKYPIYCFGVLTISVNNKLVQFGKKSSITPVPGTMVYESRFWRSGGSTGFANGFGEPYVLSGEWILIESNLPAWLKPYGKELITLFNNHVPPGCCGGCL